MNNENYIDEYFDVLDEQGEKTGTSRSHAEVHREGLFHRAVHVWFLNSQGQLLLQKRSHVMDAYPSYWDISASGHVSKGQSSIEAAKMETLEELGVSLPVSAFQLLCILKGHVVLNNGTRIENEFQDVYLVHLDKALSELTLQAKEVVGVRWIDVSEFKSWILGEGELLVPHEEEYKWLLLHIENIK